MTFQNPNLEASPDTKDPELYEFIARIYDALQQVANYVSDSETALEALADSGYSYLHVITTRSVIAGADFSGTPTLCRISKGKAISNSTRYKYLYSYSGELFAYAISAAKKGEAVLVCMGGRITGFSNLTPGSIISTSLSGYRYAIGVALSTTDIWMTPTIL